MSGESDVQLLAEGTGPLIRTLEVDTYVDETATTVHQQVVTLADKFGRLIDNETSWRQELLAALKHQNELLELIAESVSPG